MLMLRAAAAHARASWAEGRRLAPALGSLGSLTSSPSPSFSPARAAWQRRSYTAEESQVSIPPVFTREEFRQQKHMIFESDAPTIFQYLMERFKRKLYPSRGEMHQYIKACETQEDLNRTFYLYGLLRVKYTDLHVESGGLLMEACIRKEHLDAALRLLFSHRVYRLGLPKTACVHLVAALGKAGRYEEMVAAALFCYHVKMNMADKRTFNAVIYSLCAGEKLSEAIAMMKKMQDLEQVYDKFQFRIILTECNRQMAAGDEKASAAAEIRQQVAALLKEVKIDDPRCQELLSEEFQVSAANADASEQAPEEGDKK
ncbi:hypothetical protein GUITHDRAFT_150131 [Guillardia theta CCMP2712]|uniref:Pentacotripeptide-repeat region of PRORP domain-containing protein n=1 Tax=Guillardia theta (strain CCMP2712) TaxID=905079 RepID=L1K0F2_GUITC|nr:hypothetical protein GUITHDRAFT_150131 [Guillardia theta CCMP2712]EKX54044.1 hypothetical protein GUITHDRAFT_150131 [Guillardia theta CCMP2712]|eukprot:XP_005841024.1 hypothetical protein GUITHDRAFT_150131 [Guillardia theta CCMP2712]